MPAIVPLVAASLLWIWMFNPSYGLINQCLAWLLDTAPVHGVEHLISHFTAQPFHFASAAVAARPALEQAVADPDEPVDAGGGMIIWLAGLAVDPAGTVRGGDVDGAERVAALPERHHADAQPVHPVQPDHRRDRHDADLRRSYIMTEGGPADSTLFYAYYLFKQAFQYFRMGYASALAWILFLVVLVLTLLQLWLSKKWVHYEQA